MPGMNGIEAYKQLRNNPDTKHIPVILMSGEAGLGRTIRNMDIPQAFLEYIEKPFDIEKLLQKINNLINNI